MIEKFITGRYINLGQIVPQMAGAPVAGFQPVTPNTFQLAESELKSRPTGNHTFPAGANPSFKDRAKEFGKSAADTISSKFQQQRTSQVVQTEHATKLNRNFRWLEWIGGMVSEVPLNGVDVLTGPMSGCWIMRYMRNHVSCVGHVGTVMTPTDQLSIDARNAWNTFSANAPIASCTGFRPFNDWVNAFPVKQSNDDAAKIFALVTAAGQFYSIFTYSVRNQPQRLRIAGVQQCPNSLPANFQI
jgi:hypothetical protein